MVQKSDRAECCRDIRQTLKNNFSKVWTQSLVTKRAVMDKLKGPMLLFDILLVLTTLTCALVTGFILTFAVVVMPGIASLSDRDFIRAFQVTDGVIQRGQPVFSSIWIGSVIATVGLLIASITDTDLPQARLTILLGVVYLLGVQGVTVAVHLPLNRHIQNVDVAELDEQTLREEREHFEERWNNFNIVRTVIAVLVTVMLLAITLSR